MHKKEKTWKSNGRLIWSSQCKVLEKNGGLASQQVGTAQKWTLTEDWLWTPARSLLAPFPIYFKEESGKLFSVSKGLLFAVSTSSEDSWINRIVFGSLCDKARQKGTFCSCWFLSCKSIYPHGHVCMFVCYVHRKKASFRRFNPANSPSCPGSFKKDIILMMLKVILKIHLEVKC